MKVRIRDDMKVPRALKQHAIHTRSKKKKKFTKTKKLHLGNFTLRTKVLDFLIDAQFYTKVQTKFSKSMKSYHV